MIRTFFTDMRATLDLATSVLFFLALAAVWYGGLSLFLPSEDPGRRRRGEASGEELRDGEAENPTAALAGWALLAGWTALLLCLTYSFRKPLFAVFDFAFG